MKANTHLGIDASLCGTVLDLSEGVARVALQTTPNMSADGYGLVHGGFVFGMADYAAMLAVNDPNVVLGGAEVRFLRPVRQGARIEAQATVTETKGKKRQVRVEAKVEDEVVFEGNFTCFVLEKHVLDTGA